MTWNLLKSAYCDVKKCSYEVAVLPLGATEPHNLHLPYGTDVLEAQLVGERVCSAAHDQGAKVVLLPTIPYGTETNLREFPLAINVNPSTLYAFITDIVDSLVKSGVQKIILLNSHGGNGMKPLLRELYGSTPAQLFLCNWYDALKDCYFDIFEHMEDHAGEMETSFMMAFHPELVAKKPDGSMNADDATRSDFQLRHPVPGKAQIKSLE